MPPRFASLALLLLVTLDLSVRADTISGRVVDANGVGVHGVDIDVNNLGSGGDPAISNDGTDINGFFTTTLPAGVYEVFFKPPSPPVTSLLTTIVGNVSVAGTRNMGVIVLQAGVVVSGRVLDSGGIPVSQLPVDVTDVATGDPVVMNGAVTNAFGNFAVAVPTRSIFLDLDPIGVAGRTLVPRRFSLAPAADTNLGNITLADGIVLSGTFRNSLGAGVNNVDLDVFESAPGIKVFTPHDSSNASGAFSMVLAPGTYDVEACPTFASRLVAVRVEGLVLQGSLNSGITTLQSGVVLSGRVRDVNGVKLPGIDVDVRRVPGGSVLTCGDDTNAMGHYAVVVPTGTRNAGFAFPGQHGTSGEDLHAGLTVTGDLVLDGVLPRPLAEFAGAPTTGPSPLQVSFQDQSSGAVTGWSWDFGDFTAPSTLENPSHAYSSPGSYTVSLTVSGPGGPDTRTRAGYVAVIPPPPVAGFAGAPTSGVAPLTVQFTNQSTGSVASHSWTFGDAGTSTLASPSHVYSSPGTYTVSLNETGPGGSDTLTRTGYVVVDDPPPVAGFVGAPTGGGAPLTVQFTNQSTGTITSHSWSFGDGATSTLASPGHVFASPGTYTVSLTETGPGGSNTRTRTGYIVVNHPAPVAGFVGEPT